MPADASEGPALADPAVFETLATLVVAVLALATQTPETSCTTRQSILRSCNRLHKAAAFAFLDPELIRERAAPGPGVDRGDVVLATLGFLALYPGTFVVAGLDAVRFGPALPMAQSVRVAALLVYASGYGFAYWAVYSNPFFATFVRIQEDRDHSVVSSGPYALIRHPGYAGALLAHLAASRIPLEVCPVSNVRTRVVDTLDDHPLPALMAAGVEIAEDGMEIVL